MMWVEDSVLIDWLMDGFFSQDVEGCAIWPLKHPFFQCFYLLMQSERLLYDFFFFNILYLSRPKHNYFLKKYTVLPRFDKLVNGI